MKGRRRVGLYNKHNLHEPEKLFKFTIYNNVIAYNVKHWLLLILFSALISSRSFSQDNFKISYSELKEYEGKYEYIGNGTLEMAASPKDLNLYAIIDEARYRLTPERKDVFLNPGKQEVEFIRNATKKITGYKVKDDRPDDIFKLLSKEVTFSDSMWYPRKNAAQYKYIQPPDIGDALQTGSLKGIGLDSSALVQMVDKIADGSLPNVHSVLI